MELISGLWWLFIENDLILAYHRQRFPSSKSKCNHWQSNSLNLGSWCEALLFNLKHLFWNLISLEFFYKFMKSKNTKYQELYHSDFLEYDLSFYINCWNSWVIKLAFTLQSILSKDNTKGWNYDNAQEEFQGRAAFAWLISFCNCS